MPALQKEGAFDPFEVKIDDINAADIDHWVRILPSSVV